MATTGKSGKRFPEHVMNVVNSVANQIWDAIVRVRVRGTRCEVLFENDLKIVIERPRGRRYFTATTSTRVYEGTVPHAFCVLLWMELSEELRVYNPAGRLEVLCDCDLDAALAAVELFNSDAARAMRQHAARLAA